MATQWNERACGQQARVLAEVDNQFTTVPGVVRNAIKNMLGALQPTDGVEVHTAGFIDTPAGVGNVSIQIDRLRLIT